MRAGMIDMESNTTLVQCYPAHEAVPDGTGPFPPVIVLHGPFGLNAFIRATTNRLASQGFYALAPDFYATPVSFAGVAPDYMRMPTGGPIDYADRDAALARAHALPDERAMAIFRQALGYLTIRSCARNGGAGVIGFSSGARLALLAACAHPDDVRACVGFAVMGVTPGTERGQAVLDRLDAVRCPILLFFGGLDRTAPKAERDVLLARLARLGKTVDAQLFREAEQDFFVTDRDSCDISSSRAAWTATLALLRNTAPAAI
jgi:carboxymethylenebutenolidase